MGALGAPRREYVAFRTYGSRAPEHGARSTGAGQKLSALDSLARRGRSMRIEQTAGTFWRFAGVPGGKSAGDVVNRRGPPARGLRARPRANALRPVTGVVCACAAHTAARTPPVARSFSRPPCLPFWGRLGTGGLAPGFPSIGACSSAIAGDEGRPLPPWRGARRSALCGGYQAPHLALHNFLSSQPLRWLTRYAYLLLSLPLPLP